MNLTNSKMTALDSSRLVQKGYLLVSPQEMPRSGLACSLFAKVTHRCNSDTDLAILTTHDRPLLSCYTPFPNILPRFVSSASARGRLYDRHVPSPHHASNNIHVHNRHTRKRYCECIRPGTTTTGWIQLASWFPRLVWTRQTDHGRGEADRSTTIDESRCCCC
jgi:hypothetical protein